MTLVLPDAAVGTLTGMYDSLASLPLLATFGQAPLCFYFVHLYLSATLAALFFRRALKRLQVIVPLSVLMIFSLLFWAFRSMSKALLVLFMVPFTAIGGLAGLAMAGLHLSISAAVGFIVLAASMLSLASSHDKTPFNFAAMKPTPAPEQRRTSEIAVRRFMRPCMFSQAVPEKNRESSRR